MRSRPSSPAFGGKLRWLEGEPVAGLVGVAVEGAGAKVVPRVDSAV